MQKKRLRLGILFYFRPQWMGGIIYILNIIKTLGHLRDEEKPEIILFYNKNLKGFVDEVEYPYLTAIEWRFPSIASGNILSFLRMKNVFVDSILKNYWLDALYPLHDYPVRTKTEVKLVSWWADLQEKHYPEFFSRREIFTRNIRARLILRNADDLVVSSQDVLDDFKLFYKIKQGLKIHIYHFVSIIDDLEDISIKELRDKYTLPEDFFIVSNQFHKHKNHRTVLLSLAALKEKGIKRHVAFTGKFPNATSSPYLAELHDIIKENKLKDQITMLGIISRSEQLQLMRHSQAVIQPSLFEGWSTVIEDAISLQVPVLASNLKVNIEQLGDIGVYFDPHSIEELSLLLEAHPQRNLNDKFYEEYMVRVERAANTLVNIFQ